MCTTEDCPEDAGEAKAMVSTRKPVPVSPNLLSKRATRAGWLLFSGNVFVWPKLCQGRGGKGFVCLEAGSQGTRAISSTQADRWVTSYGPSACTRGKTGRAWGSEGRGLITCHPVPFPAFISLILSLMGHARNAGCGKGFEKHAWR